jgi:peptidoglycan/xylan/chitin deacetylase (PgdA/CDA1 family)
VALKKRNFFFTFLLIALAGGFMLVLSILIYNYILQGVFGSFAFSSNSFSLETFAQIFSPAQTKVAILYSKKTENFLPPGSTWIKDNVTAWERYIGGNKYPVTVISEDDIEKGVLTLENFQILVMPSVKALSDREILTIKDYIDKGGCLLATGATGTFSADGKWRGWEFFKEVYGTNFTKEISKVPSPRLLTLKGASPITSDIPTGYRLKIATWDNMVATRVLDPRTQQLSFWYDFKLDSGLVKEEVLNTSGLCYGTYGKGRFVWYGFDVITIVGQREDYIVLDNLIRNSLYWLAKKPSAYIVDWPGNKKAAAIILASVEEEPQNIKNLLPYLSAAGAKATFLIDGNSGSQNSALLKSLSGYGDIAGVVDIGFMNSINDTVNKLHKLEAQITDFTGSMTNMKTYSGSSIKGIKPLYGLFDDNSLMAAAASGVKYIITDSLTDRSVPKYVVKGEEALITVTKTVRDDKEIVGRYGLVDHDYQLYTYLEDVDRLLFEGGLYVLKLHTNMQLKPEYVSVVGDILKYLKEKDVWITSMPVLYNWWCNKNKVELRVEARGSARMVIALSNVGNTNLKEVLIPVDFTAMPSIYKISTEIINTPLPDTEINRELKKLTLKVKNLKASESRIYYIDYKN